MPWQQITEIDVRDRLSGPELAAYKSAALAVGQTDPLPGIIQQSVDEVRGYIAACARNSLEEGAAVPSKLVGATVAIIRYRLISRLPLNSAALLDTRREEYKDALRLMEQVSACKFAVEEPTIKSTEVISAPSPSYSGRSRRFTRDQQEGI